MKQEARHRRRCRPGSKSVGTTCVKRLATITMPLRREIQDDMRAAAEMLRYRQQTIRDAVRAGDQVVKEIRRQNKQGGPQ